MILTLPASATTAVNHLSCNFLIDNVFLSDKFHQDNPAGPVPYGGCLWT